MHFVCFFGFLYSFTVCSISFELTSFSNCFGLDSVLYIVNSATALIVILLFYLSIFYTIYIFLILTHFSFVLVLA